MYCACVYCVMRISGVSARRWTSSPQHAPQRPAAAAITAVRHIGTVRVRACARARLGAKGLASSSAVRVAVEAPRAWPWAGGRRAKRSALAPRRSRRPAPRPPALLRPPLLCRSEAPRQRVLPCRSGDELQHLRSDGRPCGRGPASVPPSPPYSRSRLLPRGGVARRQHSLEPRGGSGAVLCFREGDGV